jgi:hypothetical protein
MTQESASIKHSKAGALATNAALLLGSLLIVLILIEVILRLMPSLISVPILAYFPSPLRQHIAGRLSLPSINDYTVIDTAERFDHGPPLYHPAPNSMFVTVRDPADIALGAVAQSKRDARGFCNVPEKAERTHADIVVLGDSFTACTGVLPTDTSSAYLEAMGGFTTYNLGVGNLGLYEYVELLRRYGLALKPRLVIMNIYEGNDLRDAVRYADFQKTGVDRRARSKAIEGFLSNSYAASFLYAAEEWLAADWNSIFGLDESFRYTGRSQGVMVSMNITNRDQGEIRDARRLRNGEIGLDLWSKPLAVFKELSQTNNFIPIVTYTPAMYTAYGESVVFEDQAVGEAMRYLSATQRKWLAAKTAELGLIYIDLTPAFQQAVKDGPLTHFPANVHLTPYGQRVTANAWKPLVDKALAQPPSAASQ